MAFDVFLSYERHDAERASWFTRLFEAQGWSVFVDRHSIPFGERFPSFIEESLRSARCVVVLWTLRAVKSNWVEAEAREALRRNCLVPVFLEQMDHAQLSFGLREIHAVLLHDWDGTVDHPRVTLLLAAISEKLASGATHESGSKEKRNATDSDEPAQRKPTEQPVHVHATSLTIVLFVVAAASALSVVVAYIVGTIKVPPGEPMLYASTTSVVGLLVPSLAWLHREKIVGMPPRRVMMLVASGVVGSLAALLLYSFLIRLCLVTDEARGTVYYPLWLDGNIAQLAQMHGGRERLISAIGRDGVIQAMASMPDLALAKSVTSVVLLICCQCIHSGIVMALSVLGASSGRSVKAIS